VNYKALQGALDPLMEALTAQKAQLDALAKENKTLADCVLELKARAAAVVGYVER
jgi:hypothetical protein